MDNFERFPFLKELGIKPINSGVSWDKSNWSPSENRTLLDVITPIDGSCIAKVALATKEDYQVVVTKTQESFAKWKKVPAPKRGEVVRQFANELRTMKEQLGKLIALEMGKIKVEGMGEVQEAIDIADMAVGMSRQLCGKTMHSERPRHRMYEQWHPLGIVGIITAFNFPIAVWAWNAMIAAIAGDTMIWKPSLKTPLCAIAIQHIANRVMEANGYEGIFSLAIGEDMVVGEQMIHDSRLPLISATGSTPVGRKIAKVVAKRLGKTILELGGNNAIIVMEDADLDLTVRAIVFGAIGTAGQRCTTTRRVIVQETIIDELLNRLVDAYEQIKIGNPLDDSTLMGPVVTANTISEMKNTIDKLEQENGKLIYGGQILKTDGFYITPAIAKVPNNIKSACHETFAPLLYVMPFKTLNEAIYLQNEVPQGLTSAIFTNSLKYSEQFLSATGSDCGIANVNIGTSGAEIGGAFGGEKDSGGGREAGSDSWKAYMRRQTNTINWSNSLPLAQGIKFGNSTGKTDS